MRIVFFGCDDFAAVNLEHLIDEGHRIVGVVTQPDRPHGRGMHVTYSPTKQIALAQGIPVFQPDSLKNPVLVDRLAWFHADLFVVIAYGKFLPQAVLDLPAKGCINLHASLLPKYRGAAPINWAILHGEVETGVTIMQMDAGMDTGAVMTRCVCPIPDDMTSAALRWQLAGLGTTLLVETLAQIAAGTHTCSPQDHARASYAPKMHKDLGHIRWDRPAREIHDLVRGLQPWPGAFTFWRGNRLKILDAAAATALVEGKPGEIVELHKDGFYVQAADRAVLVRRVHPASSHAMDARAFLAGHKLAVGEMLG